MLISSLIGLTVEINQLMIENSVLLQVNATVIAGLLVMLSITTIWSSNQKGKIRPVTTTIRKTGLYLTHKQIFSGVVPFSASAIFALISSSNDDIFRFATLLSMGIGFFLLALFGGIVVFSEKKEDLDLS